MNQQPNRVRLTASRVAAFSCPAGKGQAFLWDTDAPTMAVRVTPTGRKTFVFESRLNGSTVRVNIGTLTDWPISDARIKAQELKRLVDSGTDPRQVARDRVAVQMAKAAAAKVADVTVGDAWAVYVEERKPHWGDRHYLDHKMLAKAGGVPATRGTSGRGVTIAGPLHPLMSLPLKQLDSAVVEAWAAREAKTRATSARLAWRMLKAFLNWCTERTDYAQLLPPTNPAKTKRAREALGKPRVKKDALLKEQLTVWFATVRLLPNQVIAAYLQTLLLTGARPGEVLGVRWADINTQWRGLTIRDKVEGERVIPLTPFVEQLLASLPRRNEWVFSSPASANGRLVEVNQPHHGACRVAGIGTLTLHGLRRSFKSLTEWLDIPAGVVAQLMGHKPSATAEKHYTVRPLDLLRVHHEKIEAWILEQAGVQLKPRGAKAGQLHAVGGQHA